MEKNWLDNKTVIVTGASSGMGKGITEKLIKEHGCKVLGVARSEKKMEALVAELGEYASQFSYQLFDVSVRENWDNYVAYLNENEMPLSQVDEYVLRHFKLPSKQNLRFSLFREKDGYG